ncbi:MAG: sulfotransferase, partial [Sphingomonadaceae bacterium]|nr:sulfotransferase [Sphingomonadaceae bacterium]
MIGAATPAIQGLLDRHLIFILGCQRSGTTLTGQMLGAHPNAVLLDEPDGAPEWFLANRPTIADAEAALSEVIAKSRSKYGDPDSRYSGSRALADSVTHVAIKAPNLTYWPKTIEAWSGPKSVIFPVRDPRAVAGSMMRLIEVDFVGRQTGLIRLANRAAMPVDAVDELMLAATPLHVKRALIWRIKNAMFDAFREIGLAPLRFRYEDLVGSPAATLARIADHAGLSLDPAMLEHHGVYTGYGPGRTSRERAVDKSSLQSWRDWLTEEQATEVAARAGPLADAVGYRAAEASPRAPP